MAELIPSTTAQADSADFTLAAGDSATLYLKNPSGPPLPRDAVAQVQIKSGANYYTVGVLTFLSPGQVLTAIGTFRVRKLVSSFNEAFGVDRD